MSAPPVRARRAHRPAPRVDCQVLTSENLTEKLVVFSASPGSEDADRLALLSVIGSQGFPGGAALGAA